MNTLSRVLLTVLLAGSVSTTLADPGLRVVKAELVLRDGQWQLDADAEIELNSTVTEALRSGVPITLRGDFDIRRRHDYWFDTGVWRASRWLSIRYHPLAKSYQLLREGASSPQSFASLPALMQALGSIRGWPAGDASRYRASAGYAASLAIKLDIEALPLPLRPVAYRSPDWHLQSPRYQWRWSAS